MAWKVEVLMNKKANRISVLAGLAVILVSTSSAFAGKFDGWCWPSDGCGGPYRISNDRFATCESNCRMTSPVDVDDMDAKLYRVACTADHGNSTSRMFFSFYKTSDAKRGALVVGQSGVTKLQRCRQ
jgi:hypothetical protein